MALSRVRWAPCVGGGGVPAPPATDDGKGPWHLERLEIPEVWQKTRGAGVRVAVIDSGVVDVLGAGTSVQCLNAAGKPIGFGDLHGHGTACASLIVSHDERAPGVAPEVELISMQVAGATGQLARHRVESALEKACELADVISCSFILPEVSERIVEAVREAHRRGVIVVAAAGNDRDSASPFPERTPHALTVAALTRSNGPMPSAQVGNWIDVAAPGEALAVINRCGDVDTTFGDTSGATALVAGTVALMLAVTPRSSRQRRLVANCLDALITATARDLGEEGRDEATGYGLVDAPALLGRVEALLQNPPSQGGDQT